MKTKNTSATETENPTTYKAGKMPHGIFNVAKELVKEFLGLSALKVRIERNRSALREKIGSAFALFKAEYPDASKVDFARQIDKTVGFTRDDTDKGKGYKTHKTYRALEDMFRFEKLEHFHEDGSAFTAKEIEAADKARAKKNKKNRDSAKEKASRFQRCLMAIAHSIGISRDTLAAACERCDIHEEEFKALWDVKKQFTDMDLKRYKLVNRVTGQAEIEENAKAKVRAQQEARAKQTLSEQASAAKSAKRVTRPF